MNRHCNSTVLCPVDFSADSDNTLQYLAGQHPEQGKLFILHVAEDNGTDRETLLRKHLMQFSAYSELLAGSGWEVRFAVEYGTPADVIVDFARKHGAGLILMGSHGRNRMPRLLVGSTAETVLRQAHCPVSILRMPEIAAEPMAGSEFREFLSQTANA
ncbi:universal stress protein [Pelodictyon luteolum]|uniref:Universal stress protein family n=1 Tax=Chlorobium luteolum (strain DSM 273 / BCRC 81028 / 2530) TaxID=319225 RepID=Q3B6T5_CHLL3|nr:universal stress protein [Pelodictyon luteolum]ABB22946.1 universal stress protein family [Pelodictyon luteolum DSM 273]